MTYDLISHAEESEQTLPPLHEHPEYIAATENLNAGRWQQALVSLQALKTVYPDSDEISKLVAELEMRATMARFRPDSPREDPRRKLIRRLELGLLLVLAIGLLFYGSYELWIDPVLIQGARLRQVSELSQAADEAIIAGDYLQARQALERLQTLMPDDPETEAALARIEQVEQSALFYEDAKRLMATNQYDQALKRLAALQALDAQYRDLPELIRLAEAGQALETRFQAAETAFKAEDWAEAIAAYGLVSQEDPTYRFAAIQDRLFAAHLQYGQELIEAAGSDPDQVTDGLAHLETAQQLRPLDQGILSERNLAETYLLALQTTDTDERIELLQAVTNNRPDYAGQAAAFQLYQALLARADAFLTSGDPEAARQDLQLAVHLAVADVSAAEEQLTELAIQTSP